MSKKLSIQEVQERIRIKHHDRIMLDESTYVSLRVKCTFVDINYGRWQTDPWSVLSGHGHPKRGYATMSKKQTITRNMTENLLKKIHGNLVKLGDDYSGIYAKCTFIDAEYGSWKTSPQHVIAGGSHPKRKGQKAKKTNMQRYGVPHHMHVSEIAQICAKKTRHSKILYHWKTNKELVCVGSYEVAFVNWCNINKIDFEWQIHHKMPNDKVYIVDAYIVDGKYVDTWIEIKGYFRPHSKLKWEWFQQQFPNSQLWDKNR
ncbi:MAG: hypothetical protein WC755_08320, partial [Candidatus Woesearchaeota archaeon]